jgi:hypothetical protein
MPVNANGKTDRKALRLPAVEEGSSGHYAAPRNEWERFLCGTWQTALGLEKVGIHANYFELGGNSLTTLQIVSAASRQGIPITVGQIFKHPTIAALVEAASAPAMKGPAQNEGVRAVEAQPWQRAMLRECLNGAHIDLHETIERVHNFTETQLRHLVRVLYRSFGSLGWQVFDAGAGAELVQRPLERGLLNAAIRIGDSLGGGTEPAASPRLAALMREVRQEIVGLKGPLFRAVWFPEDDGTGGLALVAHPILMDDEFWRDLVVALRRLCDEDDAGVAAPAA